jgi:CRISPR/Cas system-associated protein Cas7 (RAMP superfamily)
MDKVEYLEEQTFFNNGQFTEAEMDLMNEALNQFLQDLNRRQTRAVGLPTISVAIRESVKIEEVEDLIEKLQEGS